MCFDCDVGSFHVRNVVQVHEISHARRKDSYSPKVDLQYQSTLPSVPTATLIMQGMEALNEPLATLYYLCYKYTIMINFPINLDQLARQNWYSYFYLSTTL